MARTITFTTNIGCRVNCKFCPQDDIMKSYAEKENIAKINFGDPSMMSYEAFVTMIEKVPKDVVVILSLIHI